MKETVIPAYQPIIDLQSMALSHFEALARLKTAPQSGGHGRLIDLAETHGFVHQLDVAMMEHVLADMPTHACSVAVNVSPFTIQNHAHDIIALIRANEPMMERVIIEITETAPVHDIGALRAFMEYVRCAGGRIALDDYGNGKGCFSEDLVRALRPDFLKLDGAVLDRSLFFGDTGELALACEMVESFGGKLIAEFVDSEKKIAYLRNTGIRFAQGYYFGMPNFDMKVNTRRLERQYTALQA